MSAVLHYNLQTQADQLIYKACIDLEIDPESSTDIYNNVYRLRDRIKEVNDLRPKFSGKDPMKFLNEYINYQNIDPN